jgi:hypothetical protein
VHFLQRCTFCEGLDKTDENVHYNPGFLSDQDKSFHEGLCQVGHSTSVLDDAAGGCRVAKELGIISDPGNSGDNRQDD